MNRQELLAAFSQTLSDGRISRSEQRALRSVVAESGLSDSDRRALRHDVLGVAGDAVAGHKDKGIVAWLGDALALLEPDAATHSSARDPRVLFGPEDPMVETVVGLIKGSRRTLDVCVFTITDDRIRDALLHVHKRGVAVRILSDGDKSSDAGSDIASLDRRGIPVRLDWSDRHFHHKFAVFDGSHALTGSYNWTRGADRDNRENILVTWEASVVEQYNRGFERMWRELG